MEPEAEGFQVRNLPFPWVYFQVPSIFRFPFRFPNGSLNKNKIMGFFQDECPFWEFASCQVRTVSFRECRSILWHRTTGCLVTLRFLSWRPFSRCSAWLYKSLEQHFSRSYLWGGPRNDQKKEWVSLVVITLLTGCKWGYSPYKPLIDWVSLEWNFASICSYKL